LRRESWGRFSQRRPVPNTIQYTAVQLFKEAPSDELRFDAAFTNRRSYINGLEEEVREWLREIARVQSRATRMVENRFGGGRVSTIKF
tara:strand:+ start:196 stop:459 length:264 start_codon:yes stop_codon:yes gene_type:complete